MRPFRLVYIFAFALSTLILLLSISRRHKHHGHASQSHPHGKPSALRSMFSLRSPLFPASAIISLTDDNSTFFLSRPAAFGAELPVDGLSGQLWIGSGFGEDSRGWVGSTNLPEGELGCSDVPGWDETYAKFGSVTTVGAVKNTLARPDEADDSLAKTVDLSVDEMIEEQEKAKEEVPQPATKDDGTDDYLFQPGQSAEDAQNDNHNADIQSLQESAEISGKVVLLSRGGCGFLDKAKWAQRRGGVALIVGDNMPGGPLVTMYARGDTSNISIPALFTSHTTAHLLSSLIPLKNGGKAATTASSTGSRQHNNKKNKAQKSHTTKKDAPNMSKNKDGTSNKVVDNQEKPHGFFGRLFSVFRRSGKDINGLVSPKSEDDWVLVQDWQRDGLKEQSQAKLEQEFVIGVQDWRDLGLTKDQQPQSNSKAKQLPGFRGAQKHSDGQVGEQSQRLAPQNSKTKGAQDQSLDHNDGSAKPKMQATTELELDRPKIKSDAAQKGNALANDPQAPHEGLWVTLTPTSMSSSPLFDTILVLVISPLVTLSVVYAVLLIRSRIRRRRWRAPKSVVDRLPVRTYHTISSSGSSTAALPTPVASSPNTPLLQSTADVRATRSRPQSRHRPRSRTESEVPGPSTYVSEEDDESLSLTESAKREKSLATWRRRYGGRQRECVVCLEEYISGVSRVMSLPCGHEFHVECITPWLTTRRRTCPICKGDVVRSMTLQDAHDQIEGSTAVDAANDDGLQARVANARNDSPSAHEPVPMDRSNSDIERAQAISGTGQQSVSDWLADWWERIRTNSWDIYDGRRSRGRSRRNEHDPDRDR